MDRYTKLNNTIHIPDDDKDYESLLREVFDGHIEGNIDIGKDIHSTTANIKTSTSKTLSSSGNEGSSSVTPSPFRSNVPVSNNQVISLNTGTTVPVANKNATDERINTQIFSPPKRTVIGPTQGLRQTGTSNGSNPVLPVHKNYNNNNAPSPVSNTTNTVSLLIQQALGNAVLNPLQIKALQVLHDYVQHNNLDIRNLTDQQRIDVAKVLAYIQSLGTSNNRVVSPQGMNAQDTSNVQTHSGVVSSPVDQLSGSYVTQPEVIPTHGTVTIVYTTSTLPSTLSASNTSIPAQPGNNRLGTSSNPVADKTVTIIYTPSSTIPSPIPDSFSHARQPYLHNNKIVPIISNNVLTESATAALVKPGTERGMISVSKQRTSSDGIQANTVTSSCSPVGRLHEFYSGKKCIIMFIVSLIILLGGTLGYIFVSGTTKLDGGSGMGGYTPPSSLLKEVSIVFNTTGKEVNTSAVTNIRCVLSNVSNVPFKDVILSSWTETNGTVINVDDTHLLNSYNWTECFSMFGWGVPELNGYYRRRCLTSGSSSNYPYRLLMDSILPSDPVSITMIYTEMVPVDGDGNNNPSTIPSLDSGLFPFPIFSTFFQTIMPSNTPTPSSSETSTSSTTSSSTRTASTTPSPTATPSRSTSASTTSSPTATPSRSTSASTTSSPTPTPSSSPLPPFLTFPLSNQMIGFSKEVSAFTVYNRKLYVGGAFKTFGDGTQAKGIVAWDGTSWSTLPNRIGGSNGVDGQVYALFVYNDKLYIGGSFTFLGDGTTSANNIVAWDGTSWSILSIGSSNNGIRGPVYALVVYKDKLYVGGAFYFLDDGTSAKNIVAWNGTIWSTFLFDGVRGHVKALGVYNNFLYIGGSFTLLGDGTIVKNIVAWDGTLWLTAISNAITGAVYALSVYDSKLYISGSFQYPTISANIVAWNGTSWSTIPAGFHAVTALVVHNNILYMGGVRGFSFWDGTTWSSFYGSSNTIGDGSVVALAVFNGTIYIGGDLKYYRNGSFSQAAHHITIWNPELASFSVPTSTRSSYANAGFSGVNCRASVMFMNDLYIGGLFNSLADGTLYARNIARFDGNSWASLPIGDSNGVNGQVNALAVFKNKLYIGGLFTGLGDDTYSTAFANKIVAWDGTSWLSIPFHYETYGRDGQVYAFAVYKSKLYIGGAFTNLNCHNGCILANNIVAWDGSSWSILPLQDDPAAVGVIDPYGKGNVYALHVFKNILYVGGSFESPGENIAAWDGMRWLNLPPVVDWGINPYIPTIAGYNERLFIGGTFTKLIDGFTNTSNIAAWDGSMWSLQFTGSRNSVVGKVNALEVANGRLYLGGSFSYGATGSRYGVLSWDGTSISAAHSGSLDSGEVLFLTNIGDKLVVGGTFISIDGKIPANYLGYIPIGSPSPVPSPSPTASSTPSSSTTDSPTNTVSSTLSVTGTQSPSSTSSTTVSASLSASFTLNSSITPSSAGTYTNIPSPSPMDFTPRTSESTCWIPVAMSSDGKYAIAGVYGGYLYVSSNYGLSWNAVMSDRKILWSAVTMDANATRYVAGESFGYLYTSTDGIIWTQRESVRTWRSLASSADGRVVIAGDWGGYLYVSTDYGIKYTANMNDGNRGWYGASSSSSGSYLFACAVNDYIYVSFNSGNSWDAKMTDMPRRWLGISSSADGINVAAVVGPGYIWISFNGGHTWSSRMDTEVRSWYKIVMSGDASKIAATVNPGVIFISSDSNYSNWTAHAKEASREWRDIASSSDGSMFISGVCDGLLYTFP